MQVIDVITTLSESFEIPNLGHKAIVFYGPPLPKGRLEPMFTVTAWVSFSGEEYEEVVAARTLDDEVEPLVEKAKAGLITKVAPVLAPTKAS